MKKGSQGGQRLLGAIYVNELLTWHLLWLVALFTWLPSSKADVKTPSIFLLSNLLPLFSSLGLLIRPIIIRDCVGTYFG